jgi:hypothetical protein
MHQDFGFVGQTYTAPDTYQDNQLCMNWYPELSTDPNSKTVIALLGCPGLVTMATIPEALIGIETMAIVPFYFKPSESGVTTFVISAVSDAVSHSVNVTALTSTGFRLMNVANETSAWVYVDYTNTGVAAVASIATGYPVAPYSEVQLVVNADMTYVSAICGSVPVDAEDIVFTFGSSYTL